MNFFLNLTIIWRKFFKNEIYLPFVIFLLHNLQGLENCQSAANFR
jgi:hypothetical protein